MNKKLKAKIIEEFGSQADFAQAMKIDETVVSRIINGRRVLNAEDEKKWCRVLGCDRKVLQPERD